MRFVFRIEANEKRDQTEDEAQWTMGRKKRKGEARFLPSALLCAQIFIERETYFYDAVQNILVIFSLFYFDFLQESKTR